MNKLSRRDFLQAAGSAVAGMAFIGIAGCAPTTKPEPTATTTTNAATNDALILNYWTGWGGVEFEALQKAVDRHNLENPNRFFTMTTVYGQYDKVLTAIAGGNPPDVVSAVWLHQLASMAGRDGLVPVTEYAQADEIDGSEYWPNVWDSWHLEEPIVGPGDHRQRQYVLLPA